MIKYAATFFIALLGILSSFDSNAQQQQISDKTKDSIKNIALEHAALLIPKLRQFSITHEENAFGNMKYKYLKQDVAKSRFRSSRTNINFNVPIINHEKDKLAFGFGVVHQFYGVEHTEVKSPIFNQDDNNTYMPMMTAALTYIRSEKLFNRSFNFVVNGKSIFNPDMSKAQLTFMGMASTPIFQRKNSRLSLGATILMDPASPTPFFATANYFHKFVKPDIDLIIDLPFRAAVRKDFKNNFSLSFVTELGGNNSFYNTINMGLNVPEKWFVLSTLELKSGLMLEYRLTQKLVLSLNGGCNYMVNSKIRENNSKPKDYFLKTQMAPVPYVQVGLSLLPFWKGLNL